VPTEPAAPLELRLAKALSHPLRQRLLERLGDRVASPVELAKEVEQPLNLVAYHVRVLERRGILELVRTRPRRGATEHFYRAAVPAVLDDSQWRRLPASVRNLLVGRTLEHMWDDTAAAAESGRLARDDVHVTRMLLELDQTGWREVSELLVATYERVQELQEESRVRIAESDEEPIGSELAMLHFERDDSPAGEGQDAAAQDAGAS
jgi:DNA-binding transcriptional ArsR family regulator